MNRALAFASALLVAGCAQPGTPGDDGTVERPKATSADYRELAESVMDAIAALPARLSCLEGFHRPEQSLDADFGFQGKEVSFKGRMTLSDSAAGRELPIRLGRLRLSVDAEGPLAELVHEAIREAALRSWSTFTLRVEP